MEHLGSPYRPQFDLVTFEPHHQTSNIPVLIAPGYASDANSYGLLGETLSNRERRVYGITYLYGKPHEPRKAFGLPDVDKIKQTVLLAAIQQIGHPVDVVAHSKDAYDITKVAIDYPDMFRNIVMVAPANLCRKQIFSPQSGHSSSLIARIIMIKLRYSRKEILT